VGGGGHKGVEVSVSPLDQLSSRLALEHSHIVALNHS
jgi:hypothetical protein